MTASLESAAPSRLQAALVNAAAFALVPALAALGVALFVSVYPPEFAHPSQAAALNVAVLGLVLALGMFGVFASILSRMTPDPLAGRLRRSLGVGTGTGIALGLIVMGLDYATGFSSLVARQLNVDSIHIDFPASLYVYAAGAIAVECLYRLVPVSIAYLVVARWVLRGRGEAVVFWILASLTSFIEPLSQAGLVGDEPSLVWALFAFIFVFNLSEALLWRRYGWVAPIVSRLAFYAVWHVLLGPLLAGAI